MYDHILLGETMIVRVRSALNTFRVAPHGLSVSSAARVGRYCRPRGGTAAGHCYESAMRRPRESPPALIEPICGGHLELRPLEGTQQREPLPGYIPQAPTQEQCVHVCKAVSSQFG